MEPSIPIDKFNQQIQSLREFRDIKIMPKRKIQEPNPQKRRKLN